MQQDPTLLLGVQVLDQALLSQLSALAHIDGFKLVPAGSVLTGDQRVHLLRDADGLTIGHLMWAYSQPGTRIIRAALPAVTVSLMIVVLLTVLAAITMRRLTRRLAESEQAALFASRHDAATGLSNRGWFMSVLEDLMSPSSETGGMSCVMLIDCDYFKAVNDTFGHAAGNAVLRAVGARLQDLEHRMTIAGWIGGDEFALVTKPLKGEDVMGAIRRVELALMQPVHHEGHIITVSVSIGATLVWAPSSLPIDVPLGKADLALYRAKREGRGCSRVYDPVIDTGEMPALPFPSISGDDRTSRDPGYRADPRAA